MPSRSRPRLAPAAAALSLFAASAARAASCTPATAQSTCIDADAVATPFAPSPFFFLSSARAPNPTMASVGMDFSFSHLPVVLHAASPDPDGRDVYAVRDVLDATLTGALVPFPGLELGAALPFALFRAGRGLSGVTSQTGPDLPEAALRDLRFGAGYALLRRPVGQRDSSVGALLRLELSLPTGAQSSFAGERSVMVVPGFDLDYQQGRFFAAAEERVRLREPVELGGARLGSQLVSALGVGVDVLAPRTLSLTLEAFIAPYLSSSPVRTLPDGTRVDPGIQAPAEWLFSVRARTGSFAAGLGGGTAIPLSTETRTSPSGVTSSDTYAPVTTPEFRFMATVRYVAESRQR